MRRATLLAFLTFVAAALLATYPLLRQPSRTIAGGLADPIILTTVLAWDADGTWAWRLKDIDPRPPPAPNLTLLDPKAFDMRASHEPSRLPLIFDANLDTRWLTGERQAGTEWVEVRLPRPAHLRRLEIVGGGRSVLDYPQRLRIDSTDSTGVSQVVVRR